MFHGNLAAVYADSKQSLGDVAAITIHGQEPLRP
jgi:hypothetical protein